MHIVYSQVQYMLLFRVKQENLEFLDEMEYLAKKDYLDYQESRCVLVCVCVPVFMLCFLCYFYIVLFCVIFVSFYPQGIAGPSGQPGLKGEQGDSGPPGKVGKCFVYFSAYG